MVSSKRGNRLLVWLLFFAALPWAGGENIAFFYALEADWQALKSAGTVIGQPTTVGSRKIHRLMLGPHTVYAVKMEAGSVETAISAQALLSRFRCDWAFAVGPAGSLSHELAIGKWYRVGQVVAWQRKAVGSSSERWTIDWSRLPKIGNAAFTSVPRISLVSGEAFVQSASLRDELHRSHEAAAVDMNSFGLAAVCADHGVPLFIWKVISDNADEEAPAHFRSFVNTYDGEGGRLIAELLRDLPAHPNEPMSFPSIRSLIEDKP